MSVRSGSFARGARRALAVLGFALCAACGRNYELQPSSSFRAYTESKDVKWITPDGVRLKVRTVENYPRADLHFWKDALSEHLLRQGYALTSSRCFTTQSRLNGCRLDFLLPHGAEDWVLSETLFVVDEELYLVEATGPFERFSKLDSELQEALLTFRLKD